MKIGMIAARSGLSVDTLRYYERIGLLPRPPRNGAGQRSYGPESLDWIAFIGRLKATQMPLLEMVSYARLRHHGPATERDRCALLRTHRDRVRATLVEIEAGLAALDAKIALYSHPIDQEPTDD